MNPRYRIYVGAIALLAAVNLGRWVLHGATGERAASERTPLAQDFRLHVDVPNGVGRGRDLFAGAGSVAGWTGSGGAFSVRRRVARRPVVKKVALQPVSAPGAAQLMAQNGLSRLRLLGVVFHAGKRQAYLAQDKENCIAAAGDTIFGQYIVDKVTVDAVQLRDIKTNMTRRIPVSGK